jgi:hypothetical protein
MVCIIALVAVAGLSFFGNSQMRFRRYADPLLREECKVRRSYGGYFTAGPDPTYVWHLETHGSNFLSRIVASSYFKGDEADVATAAEIVRDHVTGFVASPAATAYWKRGYGYKKFLLLNSNDVYFVVMRF